MSFDIEAVAKGMLAAMSGVISDEWPGVKDCAEEALKKELKALGAIAKARFDKEITAEERDSQLESEKVALETALLACQVKAKVMAQNAANAAIQVFKDAVEALV